MATSIKPQHSVYSPVGPSPSFDLQLRAGRLYDVEFTTDPILFNGANAGRRTARNFFSSFDGSAAVAPEVAPAVTQLFAYTVPAATWNNLRRAPLLYYRLISFAAGKRAVDSTLADLDYASAPFVLVKTGAPQLEALAQITPTTDGVAAAGPPPSFDIRAGTQLFFAVELATDPLLFLASNVYRRNHDNFFSSFLGMQDVAAQELETVNGVARYDVPPAVWAHLHAAPSLYYRAITARSVQGLGTVYSVDDPHFSLAPSLTVGQLAASVAEIDHRDARLLGHNPPAALCVRGDGKTECEIELATSTALLAAPAGRVAGANYFSTGAGAGVGAAVLAPTRIPLINGVATYVVPLSIWTSLGAAQFIFYRVTTFDVGPGGRINVSTSPPPGGVAHQMPGLWGGLPVDSSAAAAFVNALGDLVSITLSSDHGPRSLPGAGRVWHPAVDVAVNGIAVRSIGDGVVDNVNAALGWIRIDHGSFKTSYLHMNVPFAAGIAMGASVRRGRQIGTANTTGTAAPHLHFELEHGGKNPLNRVRHTERAGLPGVIPGVTLGPDFTPGSASTNGVEQFTIEMRAPAAGVDAMAIVGCGVSTDGDKDLVSVDVRILTELGVVEPANAYLLDYSAVDAAPQPGNQMLSANGTEGARTPRMAFDATARAGGAPALTANTRREFFIMVGPAAAGGLPQPFYTPLQAGANVGAQPGGRYDMYVLPGFTDQGRPARDWFHYMWHVTPYTDDTGPHRVVILATDLKGNSTALEVPFGVAISGIPNASAVPGSAVDVRVRLQLLDNRAGNVELRIAGVPAGWTAVGNWPLVAGVGIVMMPAGGSRAFTLTVTPPVGAAEGDTADIKVVARSGRLPAFRDSVVVHILATSVPPLGPRITANDSQIFQLSLPPFFRVETAGDLEYDVHVSDAPDFHDGSRSQSDSNFFSSRRGIAGIPGAALQAPLGSAVYDLPVVPWERLAALPNQRLYYRVLTSPDATWTIVHRSVTVWADVVPDWPVNGPTIEAPHGLDPLFVIPPAFRLHVARDFYYAVEVATDPELFDNDVKRRNEHMFFSSWFGNSLVPPRPLRAPSGHAVYHLPEPAWSQIRQEFVSGRAAQLHYIVRQAAVPAELFGTLHSSSLAHIP